MVATDYNALLPLGKWIVDKLNAAPGGRSFTWLAAECGMDKAQVSRVVNAHLPRNKLHRQPNMRTVRAIGNVLGGKEGELEAAYLANYDFYTLLDLSRELGLPDPKRYSGDTRPDLIIGGTLVEFKSTKALKNRETVMKQLEAYAHKLGLDMAILVEVDDQEAQ